jgi:GT2 family glycosyltransferase
MGIVSLLLVTWNSKHHLPLCLDSLEKQSYKNFEIIIVDNGSSDGGIVGIKERYPDLNIHVKKLYKNMGFAVANNIGARMACGKWLALLNADAFPETEWLENLVKAAEQYPNGFFSSRQIQANTPTILDGEGDVYHISGLAWRINYGYPIQKREAIEEIFSPCAAAALYPRQDFLEIGGFDEDYFSYHEDVDLGFRLRLRGLSAYYVPKATVYHVGSASTGKMSDFSVYYGHRNLVWTYLKNMPGLLFWLFLPLHLFINLYFLVSFSIKGRGKVIWSAKRDAVKELGKMWGRRKEIQAERIASASDICQALERNFLTPVFVSLQRRYDDSKRKISL